MPPRHVVLKPEPFNEFHEQINKSDDNVTDVVHQWLQIQPPSLVAVNPARYASSHLL